MIPLPIPSRTYSYFPQDGPFSFFPPVGSLSAPPRSPRLEERRRGPGERLEESWLWGMLVFALAFFMQGQSLAFSSPLHRSSGGPQEVFQKSREYVPSMPRMQFYDIDHRRPPLTLRTSRPYRVERGLEGRHISLWASHGRYFDVEKNSWQWQRPHLFCTTEDMLTQGFVNPYLIPMLERAGATVLTPRERDTQWREAIVDNDTPTRYGTYAENGEGWHEAGPGFGLNFKTLNDTIQPFTLGTARAAATRPGGSAVWMPQIPATGMYAVYVSYPQLPDAIPDARYTVYHAGQSTTFSVNQQMGGGTWIYLGTFLFESGQSERNRVVLSTESTVVPPGAGIVSCDAVRFGGGRSIIGRSIPEVTETYITQPLTSDLLSLTSDRSEAGDSQTDSLVTDTIRHYRFDRGSISGLPRYLEAARYYTQWSGLDMPRYSTEHGLDDYRDDLRTRSHYLNHLAGGSCYMPDTVGLGIPIELQMALHTDAGFHRDGSIYGTLTISTDHGDDGAEIYRSGLSRQASSRFAERMLHDVTSDLSRLYGTPWPAREARVANYSETRSPLVPSIILELLSHQSFTDMCYAHDPNFRFHASRAIYKSLLREVAHLHGLQDPVVQPLPVTSLAVDLLPPSSLSTRPLRRETSDLFPNVEQDVEDKIAVLTWQGVNDPLEPSATPTDYILYIRQGDDDWDNGSLTRGQSTARVVVVPGVHYQFRVSALNAGGESAPSAPVSLYVSPHYGQGESRTALLVDAFDRLSGPARVVTPDSLGFDLMADCGVSDGPNTTLAGCQQVFDRGAQSRADAAGLGYGGGEYTGIALAGNHHDGIALHTDDIIATAPEVSIVSMSRAAFELLPPASLTRFCVIDYIAGLQADVPHNLVHYEVYPPATRERLAVYGRQGGRLFVSGSRTGQTSDSLWLATTLHAVSRATVSHSTDGTFRGLGIDIPVYNQPGDEHYPCQQSDVIEPADADTFSAFAYGETLYSAGIAWGSGVVMAFPYDCISDTTIRRSVMRAVSVHLGMTESVQTSTSGALPEQEPVF